MNETNKRALADIMGNECAKRELYKELHELAEDLSKLGEENKQLLIKNKGLFKENFLLRKFIGICINHIYDLPQQIIHTFIENNRSFYEKLDIDLNTLHRDTYIHEGSSENFIEIFEELLKIIIDPIKEPTHDNH